jgi:hypothetical protein
MVCLRYLGAIWQLASVITGVVHELGEAIDNEGNVWSCKGYIPKCTNNTAVKSGIREYFTIISKQVDTGSHWSANRFSINHFGWLENIKHVVALREKNVGTVGLQYPQKKKKKFNFPNFLIAKSNFILLSKSSIAAQLEQVMIMLST